MSCIRYLLVAIIICGERFIAAKSNIPVIPQISLGKEAQLERSECIGYEQYLDQWEQFYKTNVTEVGPPKILTRKTCNQYGEGNCDVDIVSLKCFNHPIKGMLYIVTTEKFIQKITYVSCKNSNSCRDYSSGLYGTCSTKFCTIGNVLVCQANKYFWVPLSVEDCVCN